MQCTDIFTICVVSMIECDLELQIPIRYLNDEENCIVVEGEAGTRTYTIPFTYRLGSQANPAVGGFSFQYGTGLVAVTVDDRRGNIPPTTVTLYNLDMILPSGITIENGMFAPNEPDWTGLPSETLNAIFTFEIIVAVGYSDTMRHNIDMRVIFDDGGPF